MGEAAKPLDPPRFITVAAASERYGFKNPLACKRFCLRHGLTLVCTGKTRFVDPREIEDFIAGKRPLPANEQAPGSGAEEKRADALAAKIMKGGRT